MQGCLPPPITLQISAGVMAHAKTAQVQIDWVVGLLWRFKWNGKTLLMNYRRRVFQ
jgi:hypothetical protein